MPYKETDIKGEIELLPTLPELEIRLTPGAEPKIETNLETLSNKVSRLRGALKAIEIRLHSDSERMRRLEPIDWTVVNGILREIEIEAQDK